MALLISGIRLPLGYQEEDLVRAAAKQISIDAKEIHSSRLLRRSLDARKKQDIHYLASAAVELSGEAERRILRKNPSDKFVEALRQDRQPPACEAHRPGECYEARVPVGTGQYYGGGFLRLHEEGHGARVFIRDS